MQETARQCGKNTYDRTPFPRDLLELALDVLQHLGAEVRQEELQLAHVQLAELHFGLVRVQALVFVPKGYNQ